MFDNSRILIKDLIRLKPILFEHKFLLRLLNPSNQLKQVSTKMYLTNQLFRYCLDQLTF
jgi:hypothetical protein